MEIFILDGKEQYCSVKKGIPRTFLKVKEGPGKNDARGEAGAAFEFVFMFLLLWRDFWATIKELYLPGIL